MTRRTPRTAFTLIEMLVAIALAIVILGLTIYIVNSAMFDSYRVVGSGDRLHQWLMIAKNRALRDKAPRGLRLYVKDVNGVKVVQEAAYIEQPVPFNPLDSTGGGGGGGSNVRVIFHYPLVSGSNPPQIDTANRRVYIAGATYAQLTQPSPQIKAGDKIYFPDLRFAFIVGSNGLINDNAPNNPGGSDVRIDVDANLLPDLGAAHTPSTATAPNNGTIAFPFGASNANTTNSPSPGAVVIRRPDVLLGEPTLQIPSGMAIDTTLSQVGSANLDTKLFQIPGPPLVEYYDILFAPSGELVGINDGFIGLLLRDMNKVPGAINLSTAPTDYEKAGEMVIVAIYPRTGAIATHPVANEPDPPPGQNGGRFKFAKDAINTGL